MLGRGTVVRLPARELVLQLLPEWRGSAKLIFIFRDDFEPELAVLENFLSAGAVLVDVGANYGIYSLAASRLVGASGRIFAFEPARSTFSVLEKNIALNRIANVQPVCLALSDGTGEGRLYHHVDSSRNSLMGGASAQEAEVVQVSTLDRALLELGAPRVDFVKIDAEGADELVCRGALDTLQKDLPVVMFEHLPAARVELPASGAGSVLAGLGYEFHKMDGARPVRIESKGLPEGNIVAVHPKGGRTA
jgi:FkbM family methyltransferase